MIGGIFIIYCHFNSLTIDEKFCGVILGVMLPIYFHWLFRFVRYGTNRLKIPTLVVQNYIMLFFVYHFFNPFLYVQGCVSAFVRVSRSQQ